MTLNRTRIWFALFVLVIFCLGASTGALADRFLSRPPGPRPGDRGPEPRGGRGPGPLAPKESVDELLQELHLPVAQRAQFDQLMSDRRGRLEQFYQEVQIRFESEQRELRDGIRAMLTSEQRQRFDAWLMRQPPPPPGLLGGPPGRGRGPRPPEGPDGR